MLRRGSLVLTFLVVACSNGQHVAAKRPSLLAQTAAPTPLRKGPEGLMDNHHRHRTDNNQHNHDHRNDNQAQQHGGGYYRNPVVGVDAPDPGVLRVDSNSSGERPRYWAVTTSGNAKDAFPIRTSANLVDWELVGHVFPNGSWPSWAASDFWAPELHIMPDGAYRVYFTARCRHTKQLSIGVATTPSGSLAGPWVDSGAPILTNPLGTIDATYFHDTEHDDGGGATPAHYLVWKVDGNSGGKPTPLYARQLRKDGLGFADGTDAHLLLQQDQPWEGPLVEAPWLVWRDPYYYLFYSGSGFASSAYAIGVARSTSLLGPYKKACAPVLSFYPTPGTPGQGPRYAFAGPGHCSVVRSGPTSDDWVMVYHAWLGGKVLHSPGRNVLVDRVEFGPDGWPVVGRCGNPTADEQPVPFGIGSSTSSVSKATSPLPSCPRGSTLDSQHEVVELATPSVGWSPNATLAKTLQRVKVLAGNCGGATVSLQAVDRAGWFFRHRDGVLRLEHDDGSDMFRHDSSFMYRPGLALNNSDTVFSLRSVNYPHNYLAADASTHLVRLDNYAPTTPWTLAATWSLTKVTD
eukprot:m.18860 g.18860  ORF g.18860 m.18860 type:complete len:574 (+) comp5806_c0_seq1:924-2645(+)